MLNQRSDKLELLRIVEAVATEKAIDREIVLSSMESAIQKAAKTKFGLDNNIRATIDRESGDISLHKVLTIVETPENFNNEISLENAKKMENKGLSPDAIGIQIPPTKNVNETIIYDMNLINRLKIKFKEWKYGWKEQHHRFGDEFDEESYIEGHEPFFIDIKKSIKTKIVITGNVLFQIIKINNEIINGECNKSYDLKEGDQIDILTTNKSAYGYLAIEGGFDLKPFCNSVSILARAHIGPNDGEKIKIKDKF